MRTAVTLYALALLVRLALIALYPNPAYPDAYYYVDVARALHAGQGFNVDFIWAFVEVGGRLPVDPHLPIPSNAHWMPLASLVQVPFMAVFGPVAWAGMLPFAIVGALAAPLTWLIAREAGARPAVQLGAGILAAVPAASMVFMAQPDNFSLYQPLGAAALWLGARGLKGDARAFALAGLLVGVASLARNDGVLIGLALGLLFVWDRWRAWRSAGARRPAIPLWAGVACAGLFLVAIAPWWLRQLAVFGDISPSSASGRILWIRQIADMNSVTAPATFSSFVGQGLGPLLESRVWGLVAAFGNFAVIPCSVILFPFVLVGAWLRRRSLDFRPFLLYAAILFGAGGLLFAVHVPYGMFLHSAVALVPHSYVLALEGVVAVVGWIAARRRTWSEPQAQRIFLTAAVVLGVITAAGGTWKVQTEWSQEKDLRQDVAVELPRLGATPTDRLMTADAAGFKYFTGHPGVVTPSDPLPVIETAARDYDVRWLVLERAHIVPGLDGVLKGTARPAWVGPDVYSIHLPDSPNDGYPDIAVFPVCWSSADTRCAASARGGATAAP
ncbi:MAG TPA: glycosyltransferase family 39 protein [Candidatus Limnocylindrales bacterium]